MPQTQKIVAHSERAHAMLSPSGAHRWLNCTPSAKLEEIHGTNESSVFAAEGTLAHEIADLCIKRDLLECISEEEFEQKFDDFMNNDLFKDEMLEHIDTYVNYCKEQYQEALLHTNDAVLFNERRVDLSQWIPEGSGTNDCSIIADRVLEVVDLKYGKGVPVSSIANKQLMLYGLGAYYEYSLLYDIKVVRLTIVQPRLDSISSWEISVEDLLSWAEHDLVPGALKAFNGEGELNAGEWCKFCKVKNRCSELATLNLEVAKHDFKAPELLTDDEVADIVKRAPLLVEWANSVSSYALKRAIEDGKHWPGFKVVEGISRRKWLDEDIVAKAIYQSIPALDESDIYKQKLKSITEIEKLVGKKLFSSALSSVVIKPQGKLSLVLESDKRPAVGNQAKLDFSDDNED